MTITAKLQIYPTYEQAQLLVETGRAFSKACNYTSDIVFDTHDLRQINLQKKVYSVLRSEYGLPSQLACNVVRHVIGNYRTILANQNEWIKPNYTHTTYVLSWNRDYSLTRDHFSIGTLSGRVKLPYANEGMKHYFDGTWEFGTAKVVNKHGKWFLHISATKEFKPLEDKDVSNVVGVDFGINFIATTYSSAGKTDFYYGKAIKQKRSQYKKTRQQLQKRRTASARKRLKAIGSRENRWMQDVNHQVSKALVSKQPERTLFVIEDLTGVRTAAERVRLKDRYVSVSWAFFDLRQKLAYKAAMHNARVLAVDPKNTSRTCPKCGHTEKANRDKCKHVFICKNCIYTSNDDRVGAMNLHRKGIEYLGAVTVE